jgi:hypothetical protein
VIATRCSLVKPSSAATVAESDSITVAVEAGEARTVRSHSTAISLYARQSRSRMMGNHVAALDLEPRNYIIGFPF